MVDGFAWTLRAIQGAPTTPAAPAASFRKSRRLGFSFAGFAMRFPLVGTPVRWALMDDAARMAGSSSSA
jgi:hypothetical protein